MAGQIKNQKGMDMSYVILGQTLIKKKDCHHQFKKF